MTDSLIVARAPLVAWPTRIGSAVGRQRPWFAVVPYRVIDSVMAQRSGALPSELVHQVAARVLVAADIDSLSIKGPATADLLYPDAIRESADADILVAPTTFKPALAALVQAGFTRRDLGFRDTEINHAETLVRADLQSSLDVHRAYPGIGLASAWKILWRDRMPLMLYSDTLQAPSHAARALMVALHAARNGYGDSLSGRDLRRALDMLSEDVWREAFALAEELEATEGLVAGIRFLPRGRELAARWAPTQQISPQWLLRQTGHAPTTRWTVMRQLPLKQRLRLIADEALPSRAFMRNGWPVARRGLLGLVAAHLLRWCRLTLRLPLIARHVRHARRQP